VEDLDVVGDDLADAALFAFLVLVAAVLQPPLDVEGIGFLDIFGSRFGQPIPADDGVELSLFLALDRSVGGQADGRDGFAVLGVAELGVAGGVATGMSLLTPRM
jgi:hypothetical protein